MVSQQSSVLFIVFFGIFVILVNTTLPYMYVYFLIHINIVSYCEPILDRKRGLFPPTPPLWFIFYRLTIHLWKERIDSP